jgi:membrane-bound lytic murein transglycosylase D
VLFNRQNLYFLPLLLLSQLCAAQGGFDKELLTMFKASESQWLCTSFEKSNPDFFKSDNCPPDYVTDDHDGHFSLQLPKNHTITNKYLDVLLIDDCERFLRLKALSDLYFPLFDKKIESIGLPDYFKYIPLATSAMNSGYRTPSDRAGLWQLDFLTGRKYGLTINDQIDERCAADLGTDAALIHLKFLQAKYPDDPAKLLTAYFTSVVWVEKVIAKQEGRKFLDAISEDDLLRLYYFQTVVEVFSHLKTETALFDYIELLNTYTNVGFEENVSYTALVEVLGSNEKQIRSMNPAYRGDIIPANYRSVVFILPTSEAAKISGAKDSLYRYQENMAAKLDEKRKAEEEKVRKAVPNTGDRDEQVITVRSGDVLGKIAERHGVKVSELKSWNDLNSDRIYAGQELVIYKKKAAGSAPKSSVQNPDQNTTTSTPSTSTPTGDFQLYTVQAGESLWLIARKFAGVSADNIMQWNNITSDIRPGQVLKIYTQ